MILRYERLNDPIKTKLKVKGPNTTLEGRFDDWLTKKKKLGSK
jgi:hypothetical protein